MFPTALNADIGSTTWQLLVSGCQLDSQNVRCRGTRGAHPGCRPSGQSLEGVVAGTSFAEWSCRVQPGEFRFLCLWVTLVTSAQELLSSEDRQSRLLAEKVQEVTGLSPRPLLPWLCPPPTAAPTPSCFSG